MKSVKYLAMVLAGVVSFAVAGLQVARADGLQIVCTGTTTCLAGGIETTASISPTFDVTLVGNGKGKENGELWIAVLVPVATGANFKSPSNHSLWAALGENGGGGHKFGSAVGNDPFFTASDKGFHVTDFNTGQWLSGNTTSTVIAPGTFAEGTMFVAFTENSDDVIAADSPWSESLEISRSPVPTPEPGTLALLGAGLLGLAGIGRRRFVKG